MNPIGFSDRAVRQQLLVPAERLACQHAVVVGVGAIGRQVALQLAALGVVHMTLFDDDVVGVENLAAQGYWPEDLGERKVTTTARLCERYQTQLEIAAIPEKFRRSSARAIISQGELAVFMCVDHIATRQMIWHAMRSQADLIVDGRMNGEVVRVLAAQPAIDSGAYSKSLFQASEAYVGACAARSTIYAASIAAGLMVSQFARFLRGHSLFADQVLNLMAGELSAI